jgi:hypothetical protein
MQKVTRQTLELFVEKANKLAEFKFDEHVKSVGLNWHASRTENDDWVLEFGLPDEKERDAFLLTFRLFIQDNEPYSFQNLSRLNDSSLSGDFTINLSKVLQAYFDYLSSHSAYTVELFDGRPTREEMLKTVLYGGLAHTNNPARMRRFKHWSRDDIRANLLLQEFAAILVQVMAFIKHIANLSENELKINPRFEVPAQHGE